MKICKKCKQEKELDQMGNDTRRPDGKGSYCLDCIADKSRKRDSWDQTERHFGLSRQAVKQLLLDQNNCCAICKINFEILPSNKIHIDHDHDTWIIRGILCGDCNRGLGGFRDNLANLEGAIRYLSKQIGKKPTLERLLMSLGKKKMG